MVADLKSVFGFLTALKSNNSRDWFIEHKKEYENAHQQVILFADRLLEEMRKVDEIETTSGKKSLFRIYRDVRFSKDKQPYKTHWGGYLTRLGKERRGGFYFHLEPGGSFIGGGFFEPNAEDLKQIRAHIAADDTRLRVVMNNPEIIYFFGGLSGDQLKTAPKGFDIEHPAIDLLRYKQFLLRHDFKDSEVMKKDFYTEIAAGFTRMIPLFDVMSEYLTTDLNGESLL
ncbi:MAG: DUF2461 domain-containing protein [Cyclobacteriaceae bacterium]|nr:DUF2461 domain-containing protein [Cyclobacteriaceae bacterium]